MELSKFLEQYVKIKKVGSNYFSICPFHEEKTPSFSINDTKGLFFCFGCGVTGNKTTFLSLLKKKSKFILTNEIFFDKSNFCVFEKIKIFFVAQLYNIKNFFIFNYICFVRKIATTNISLFNFGYAPNTWNALIKTLTNYDKEFALEIGVIGKTENNMFYDVFRHAIILPLKNINGVVLGFGAKSFSKTAAKYYNSSSSLFFTKNKFFYGLFESLLLYKKIDCFIIVEGYFDVIRVIQDANIPCIATLGVVVSKYLFYVILQYTKKIFFCFDGDFAGLKANFSILMQDFFFTSNKIFIFFILLPYNHDPDSYLSQNGKLCFLLKIKFSYSFYTFLFSYSFFFENFAISNFFETLPSCLQKDKIDYMFSMLKKKINNRYLFLDVLSVHRILFCLISFRRYINYYSDFFFTYFFFSEDLYFFFREIIFLLRSNNNLSVTKLYRRVSFFSKTFFSLLKLHIEFFYSARIEFFYYIKKLF